MDTILVIPKNEQEYSLIMQMLKKMKITATPVREKKTFERMTMAQFREDIDRSIEDVSMGRVVSQEELKKQMAQW